MATAIKVIEVLPYVSDEEEDVNDSVHIERKKRAKKKQHATGLKKIESMVEKMGQEDSIEDIEALQLAQSVRMFTKASNLFIKKWNKKEPKFIEYFQNQWLNSHDGWYE
ncbi:unnamed protein product, partial [Didymodactylos carnosus]